MRFVELKEADFSEEKWTGRFISINPVMVSSIQQSHDPELCFVRLDGYMVLVIGSREEVVRKLTVTT